MNGSRLSPGSGSRSQQSLHILSAHDGSSATCPKRSIPCFTDLEARISQLTLDGASPQLRSSHICQAKWRGASSDDEDLDNDSSRGRSSRGSNSYAEEDDEDDDDDDDEVGECVQPCLHCCG